MYKSIYVPVDNSEHSNTAVELSVSLGKQFEASLVGSHIYAAKLHDVRFKQMEFTLPEEYKEETELEKQRKIHDALIARGLKLISDCYLNTMDELATEAGVPFVRKHSDGRNFECIVDDLEELDSDLLILGALGQGAVKYSQAGSVCERVLRRTTVDTFVIRDPETNGQLAGEGRIVVCMDGSARSYNALRSACAISSVSGNRPIQILGVTGENIYEQEILAAHLDLARDFVVRQQMDVNVTLLSGATVETIVSALQESTPWLVAVGRDGLDGDQDNNEIGSLVEALIRTSPCNVLIAAGTVDNAEIQGLTGESAVASL
jgi:nucleotide-binding universal stress UspA family protein